jgi:tetrahydromethanopterin S-methyltransferase subunit A
MKVNSIYKAEPHPDYPCEEGRYIRGNDYSPVAVVIILICEPDKTPPEIEKLVRAGVESGAALSGTVQTANIGFEKIICNIVANPNIRYIILGGPESEGHRTGEALKALLQYGVDEKRRIRNTTALFPTLYNIPLELIERFRKQISLIDLQFEGNPEVIKNGVWSCYQEKPVQFKNYVLSDPGAYPEPPLSGSISWKVTQPWCEPENDGERSAKQKAFDLMERLKQK